MKRIITSLILILVCVGSVFADCFNTSFNAGKDAFNNRNYTKARELFVAAKVCPDATSEKESICDEWIRKIDRILNPVANQNPIPIEPSINVIPLSGDKIFKVGTVSFTMKPVVGGDFIMGASQNRGADAESDEKPTHKVLIQSFYMGQFEVTQALWKAVMGENPSSFTDDDNKPVECVSWDDCQKFIRKLNAKLGVKFRLPTEAEWEYAARGGKKSKGYKYAGGNNLDAVAWHSGNSGQETHPVGRKIANELGLYDMAGNVWEWCADWYGIYSSNTTINPEGPSKGEYKVHRGGSWKFSELYCPVSFRYCDAPDCRFSQLGLRLCLDAK